MHVFLITKRKLLFNFKFDICFIAMEMCLLIFLYYAAGPCTTLILIWIEFCASLFSQVLGFIKNLLNNMNLYLHSLWKKNQNNFFPAVALNRQSLSFTLDIDMECTKTMMFIWIQNTSICRDYLQVCKNRSADRRTRISSDRCNIKLWWFLMCTPTALQRTYDTVIDIREVMLY
jgi:hypothetical protein